MAATNRLAGESSPYLRQHAENPVDWWPWGPDALAEARRSDRPLLISIGYSACHWCHVMAHESFEDPTTAALMNELFVNVKVDREERPDVDAVYMEATQALTGSGGWPLTVFATPDGQPFYCGTYFPPQGMAGRPGFTDICRAIDTAWQTKRDELTEQAQHITDHLQPTDLQGRQLPGPEVLPDAVTTILATHDPRWGGFGGAPKFPQALVIDLLLRHHARTGDRAALSAAVTTLDAMAAGGLHDHLGGGFARYSTDAVWLVPHFEKMLSDQALLLRVYTHAWQLTGDDHHRLVAEGIVSYVARDLHQPEGGFASAEDADSEGVEGRFYLWTPAQIRAALSDDPTLAEEAIAWWGVTEDGNFEGATILNRIPHRGDLAGPPRIAEARRRLLDARSARVRPGLDDKVLTEWNGLLISSLAEAGAAVDRPEWVTMAADAARFLLTNLRDPAGRWLRSWQTDAGARHLAYAADHAALTDAFTRLAEATGEARWLDEARAVADALLARFSDNDGGGLFTTAHDAEVLVARPKDLQDSAVPSANSAAAVALLRLGALIGEARFTEAGTALLALTGQFAGTHPAAFALALAGLDLVHRGIDEVVVAGEAPDLLAVVRATWRPGVVLLWGQPGDSPLWEGRRPGVDAAAEPRAYVCHGQVCDLPAHDAAELTAQLTTR